MGFNEGLVVLHYMFIQQPPLKLSINTNLTYVIKFSPTLTQVLHFAAHQLEVKQKISSVIDQSIDRFHYV